MVRPVSDPQRTALVIAHEPDGPSGQVGVRLTERGFDVHTHLLTADYDKPQEFVPWPDWSDFDLIVLMGSVRSVSDKDAISNWVHDELDEIRRSIEADQPVLGVCFGGQLIADALGGSVEVSPPQETRTAEESMMNGIRMRLGNSKICWRSSDVCLRGRRVADCRDRWRKTCLVP